MAKKKNDYCWRQVVSSNLETGGQSILRPGMPLGSAWELKLDCGHTATRRAYYKPLKKGQPRPTWFKRRNPDDVLPPPRRVRCRICERANQSDHTNNIVDNGDDTYTMTFAIDPTTISPNLLGTHVYTSPPPPHWTGVIGDNDK